MEYHRHDDERHNPWPWVAIIVGILIFLTAAWWIASASTRESQTTAQAPAQQPTTTPPSQQPTQQPSGQTGQPGQTSQPGAGGQAGQGGQATVPSQQPPVNIYVQKTPQQPSQNPVIVVVPEGQQPSAQNGATATEVNLPPRFRYQGTVWQVATDQSGSPSESDLTDLGANIQGNEIYAMNSDKKPYDALYVETQPGSGVFVKYTKRPSS